MTDTDIKPADEVHKEALLLSLADPAKEKEATEKEKNETEEDESYADESGDVDEYVTFFSFCKLTIIVVIFVMEFPYLKPLCPWLEILSNVLEVISNMHGLLISMLHL